MKKLAKRPRNIRRKPIGKPQPQKGLTKHERLMLVADVELARQNLAELEAQAAAGDKGIEEDLMFARGLLALAEEQQRAHPVNPAFPQGYPQTGPQVCGSNFRLPTGSGALPGPGGPPGSTK